MENIFERLYKPDVLSCLADLSNDEVFTPPEVANKMLDLLPQELFRNKETKILDPACKSGVFLREAAKRFIAGERDQFDTLQECLDWIFKNQLYGIAITELTSLLSRRSVYCSKYPNSPFSIVDFGEDDVQGKILYHRIQRNWIGVGDDKKCSWCSASAKKNERPADLETHAYEWIHTAKPEDIWNMKFDVIISNPPYQLSDGGQKASATPIYNKFVLQAKKLNPRFMTFIIPARWFSGGRGLDSFRDEMLKDTRLRKMVDYTDSEDCFPGVDIAGGICYFLWDRDNRGACEVTTIHNGESKTTTRKLDEHSIFIRHGEAISILEKIKSVENSFYSSRVSSQKPFGLRTYVKPSDEGDISLRYNGGTGPFWRKDIPQAKEWIDKWKVIMSYLTYDHAGRADNEGKRRVFSTLEILPPNSVCTETYLVVDVFDTKEEAINLFKYLQTKFVRFLVSQTTSTQHIAKANFVFVPLQDFTKTWTDEELYTKYGLSTDEIAFIDSMIRPMDLSGGDE